LLDVTLSDVAASLLSMGLAIVYLLCRVDARRPAETRTLSTGQRIDVLATATWVVLLVVILEALGAIR